MRESQATSKCLEGNVLGGQFFRRKLAKTHVEKKQSVNNSDSSLPQFATCPNNFLTIKTEDQ